MSKKNASPPNPRTNRRALWGSIFPQIARFISAARTSRSAAITGKLLLWVAIGALVYTNISVLIPDAGDRIEAWAQVSFPGTRIPKVAMNISAALSAPRRVLSGDVPSVLGVTRTSGEPSQEEQTYDELNREYQHWQTVVSQYPDYRDGYYQLALLSYRLKQYDKSRAYLHTVLTLDPNFLGIAALEDLLTKTQTR